jgi:hypothetical protein
MEQVAFLVKDYFLGMITGQHFAAFPHPAFGHLLPRERRGRRWRQPDEGVVSLPSFSMQAHHDILIIIPEPSPEYINPAAMLRIFAHFDAQADGMMIIEV